VYSLAASRGTVGRAGDVVVEGDDRLEASAFARRDAKTQGRRAACACYGLVTRG
jgi:hypothetical protein